MSSNNTNYPGTMKLKTIEFDIKLLINAYDTIHKTYLQNFQGGDKASAAKNLNELNQITSALEKATSYGITELNTAIKKGSINQQIVAVQKNKFDN